MIGQAFDFQRIWELFDLVSHFCHRYRLDMSIAKSIRYVSEADGHVPQPHVQKEKRFARPPIEILCLHSA